jgi:hypothetical protein
MAAGDDSTNGHIVFFGGTGANGTTLDDTWRYGIASP